MKKRILPRGMWLLFQGSFEQKLPLLSVNAPGNLMERAKTTYEKIAGSIRPFGACDPLEINILSAAMVAAVYLCLPEKPEADNVKRYYAAAMGNRVKHLFLKRSSYYTARYQKRLAKAAERSRHSTNPYSWRFTFAPGPTRDGFVTVFDHCGICYLFRQLGIGEIVPALCTYDDTMAEQTGTIFTRKFTIAGGGPYCDCHYQRAQRNGGKPA